VERNPVRAGISDTPWDYPWSSARAYAQGTDDGLTDVDFNGPYLTLGKSEEARQSAWREYLLDASAQDEEGLFRDGRNPVGRKAFVERILVREGRMTTAHRGAKKRKGAKN
jgi:putative transposase